MVEYALEDIESGFSAAEFAIYEADGVQIQIKVTDDKWDFMDEVKPGIVEDY